MPLSARKAVSQEQPRTNKKETLQLSQLASYDDVITDALVDRAYFWTQTRKIRARYAASRGIREQDVTNIIRRSIIVEKDAQKATNQMLELPGLKRYAEKLSEDDKAHFVRHLRKYINMYLPDCPFEVTTTNRYTIDTEEAKVTARKRIRKGELVKYLSGMQVQINPNEEKEFDDTQQFSIVLSSRKRTTSLFLGPARFANHDCNANARLTPTGSHGMTVVAARDIHIGDEITVSYGGDYFGLDNCECLCATCEQKGCNGWDPTLQQSSDDDESEDEDIAENESTLIPPLLDGDVDESPQHSISTERFLTTSEKLKTLLTTLNKDNGERLEAAQRQLEAARSEVKRLEQLVESLSSQIKRNNQEMADIDTTVAQAKTEIDLSKKRKRDESTHSGSNTPSNKRVRPSEPLRASGLRKELRLDDDQPQSSRDRPIPGTKRSLASTSTSSPSRSRASASTPPTSQSDRVARSSDRDSQEMVTSDESRARLTRSTYVISASAKPSATPKESDNDLYAANPNARRPGDYLDACVLSSPCTRWVKCRVCDQGFVHPDSYHLKWSCPRCERHSKLYGYQWPKTDKEGKHDTEERIQDHREVNWLLSHEDVKLVKRGRKSQVIDLEIPQAAPSSQTPPAPSVSPASRISKVPRVSQASQKARPEISEVLPPIKKRRGRPPKHSRDQTEQQQQTNTSERSEKAAKLLGPRKSISGRNPRTTINRTSRFGRNLKAPHHSMGQSTANRTSKVDQSSSSKGSPTPRSLRTQTRSSLQHLLRDDDRSQDISELLDDDPENEALHLSVRQPSSDEHAVSSSVFDGPGSSQRDFVPEDHGDDQRQPSSNFLDKDVTRLESEYITTTISTPETGNIDRTSDLILLTNPSEPSVKATTETFARVNGTNNKEDQPTTQRLAKEALSMAESTNAAEILESIENDSNTPTQPALNRFVVEEISQTNPNPNINEGLLFNQRAINTIFDGMRPTPSPKPWNGVQDNYQKAW